MVASVGLLAPRLRVPGMCSHCRRSKGGFYEHAATAATTDHASATSPADDDDAMRLRQARKVLRKATCRREDTWTRAKRRVYGQPTTYSDRVAPVFADLNRIAKRGTIEFHKLELAFVSLGGLTTP